MYFLVIVFILCVDQKYEVLPYMIDKNLSPKKHQPFFVLNGEVAQVFQDSIVAGNLYLDKS